MATKSKAQSSSGKSSSRSTIRKPGPSQSGPPIIAASYYCVTRVLYGTIKNPATDCSGTPSSTTNLCVLGSTVIAAGGWGACGVYIANTMMVIYTWVSGPYSTINECNPQCPPS